MVMCLSQKFVRKFATYDELPQLLWLINMCMGAWSMLWLHFVIITHVQKMPSSQNEVHLLYILV